MSPVHFTLLECAFQRCGYRMVILHDASQADIDTGLRYVNNDACYPAIIVAGQLINAFASGRFDPDQCSVMMPQTGGMCRATNYVALMRKALRDAGYGQVVVLGASVVGVESNPGFKVSLALVHRAMQSIVLGDLLQGLCCGCGRTRWSQAGASRRTSGAAARSGSTCSTAGTRPLWDARSAIAGWSNTWWPSSTGCRCGTAPGPEDRHRRGDLREVPSPREQPRRRRRRIRGM